MRNFNKLNGIKTVRMKGGLKITGKVFTCCTRGYQALITVDGKANYLSFRDQSLISDFLFKLIRQYPFMELTK